VRPNLLTMNSLFVGLIALLGLAVLVEIALVIRGSLRSPDLPDGFDRTVERKKR
jgi:hypothetical protein